MRFKKGQSGNPAGKPIGTKNIQSADAENYKQFKETVKTLKNDFPDVTVAHLLTVAAQLQTANSFKAGGGRSDVIFKKLMVLKGEMDEIDFDLVNARLQEFSRESKENYEMLKRIEEKTKSTRKL